MEVHMGYEFQLSKILIATLIMMIFGMIWFSPRMFGTIWAREVGLKRNVRTVPFKAIFFTFFQTLVMVSALNALLQITEAFCALPHTVYISLLLGVGISAMSLVDGLIWRGDSWKLFIIISLRSILALLLGGVVMYYV